jgi:hypothetical protein
MANTAGRLSAHNDKGPPLIAVTLHDNTMAVSDHHLASVVQRRSAVALRRWREERRMITWEDRSW